MPQSQIDTLKTEAEDKVSQNLSRDRSRWVTTRDDAYKTGLNIANLEKMISNISKQTAQMPILLQTCKGISIYLKEKTEHETVRLFNS